ncbi:MAG TPA: chromate transporter [Clostridiales bacterium]|jgi:chromate transporter|nr:chromate transporter [Clostridiales bacterium]
MIFLKLFLTFFEIGLFTIGGGYAMLPLIQEEVIKNGWIAEAELINFIAVSESTPGPFAINIATYIGSIMGSEFGISGGIFGAFCATLGVVLPSFIIILIVAKTYEKFKKNKIIAGAMSGLKPAVIGLIAAAIINVAHTVFFPSGFSVATFTTPTFWVSAVIFAIMTVLALKKVNPIIIISISAVLGITVGYALKLPI